MNTCKNCGKETSNKSFCSVKCTCDFNNANISEESNRKRGKNNKEGNKNPKSLLDMSKRTASKILKRMNLGCSICGWNEASLDIHHILPKSKGGTDDNSNLTLLCPNHHRMAHSGIIDKFTNVIDQVGEEWRNHYYAHE